MLCIFELLQKAAEGLHIGRPAKKPMLHSALRQGNFVLGKQPMGFIRFLIQGNGISLNQPCFCQENKNLCLRYDSTAAESSADI